MTLRFKVGDIAILSNPVYQADKNIEVEILELIKDGIIDYFISINGRNEDVKGRYATDDFRLSKLPPPDTLSSWGDCAFKPNKVEV